MRLIPFFLLFVLLLSVWLFPSATPMLAVTILVFSLGFAIFSVFKKYRSAYFWGRPTRLAFLRSIFLDMFGVLLATTFAVLALTGFLAHEPFVETMTVLKATVANTWKTFPETQKNRREYLVRRIKKEPMNVPTARLPWNPAFPPFKDLSQNQLDVDVLLPDGRKWKKTDPLPNELMPSDVRSTGGVECVTTTAVDVRNMMNWYLADLTGKRKLPDLTLQDYINETDNDPDALLPIRFPSDQKPTIIAGWMHPRLQLPGALDEFSAEFEDYYGCSFDVKQTSYNTLDDIANELQQGHLVIVHGMGEPGDIFQKIINGAPHTMGSVVEINAKTNEIIIMNTDGDLKVMKVDDFLRFWDRPSIADGYTHINTMTVVVPDTVCSPINAPTTPTP